MKLWRQGLSAGAAGLATALVACGGGTGPDDDSLCPGGGGSLSLDVGEQTILQNPSDLCVFFRETEGAESYLIGIQSTSDVVTSLTPVTLTATAPGAPVAQAFAPELAATARRAAVQRVPPSATASRWARHRATEAGIRALDQRIVESRKGAGSQLASRSRTARTVIPPNVQMGDVVPVRVPGVDTGDPCDNFTTVQAVVRVVGTRGVWLEDPNNPAAGFSAADFQSLSSQLDNTIHPTDVAYFGSPSDLDGNSRIAIIITRAVNQLAGEDGSGTLGFVFSGDLFRRSNPSDPTDPNVCASSNEGEIFYGVAPDPLGQLAFGAYGREDALEDAPFIIAHELAHIIQFSRRLGTNLNIGELWLLEGQATLAEEVVGHAAEGRQPRQNFGAAVAYTDDVEGSIEIDWYANKFFDLGSYFGFMSRTERVPGAPEECSFLDTKPDNPNPCEGRDIYGSWSLLRWLSDHFGPSFAGGEQGLQRALVETPAIGYQAIQSVIGQPIETLLAQWSAMLYVDDRFAGDFGRLVLPSWNLFELIDGSLVETAHLEPMTRVFGNFTDIVNVRASSTAYFQVSGAQRPATTIRATGTGGIALPAIIQLYVVRLQ